jgi:threonine/homoserine/homoserine lactone efflux protein
MHDLLGPLILFASVMSITPGPNVVLVTASAANFGFGRTIPQIVGITLGFGTLVMAVGLGLAGLFRAEPRLHITEIRRRLEKADRPGARRGVCCGRPRSSTSSTP